MYYRRSSHFVIFGTKRVSRNSGITNFETLFSAKSQIGSKNILKSTFLANFSITYYSDVPNRRADRNKQAGLEKSGTLLAYLLSKLINEQGGIFHFTK